MSRTSAKNRVLSKQDVARMIGQGDLIVVYNNTVLRLNNWIRFHPGGDKAVHHMVGRDATDEMNAYHSDATIATFKRFQVGVIDHKWVNLVPPIQGGEYPKSGDISLAGQMPATVKPKVPVNIVPTAASIRIESGPIRDPETVIENFDNLLVKSDLETWPSLDYETQWTISQKYNELHAKIKAEGLYDCPYVEYYKQMCINGGLFLYFLVFWKLEWYFLSAVSIGLFWQQLTFIAHDAGHLAITHNYHIDNFIGILIADWMGGLSLGWWKRNHNVHHLITNDPVHDPDIQHLPFFAVSSRLLGNVYSTYYEKTLWFDSFAKFLVQFQNHLYYPILCFGRFNLYRLSWEYLLTNKAPRGKAAWLWYFEITGLSFFFYWFFYVLIGSLDTWSQKIQYILVSHIVTMIVHVQITLSHFAMSTSDLGVSETFAARQLRTTMDVDCPEWFDFFHGGLQFQAIHHLFPRLPRHNFRKAQKHVLEFCKDTGLRYSIYGFVDGNNKVLLHMEDIGKQVKIMKDCLRSMALESCEKKNIYEKRVEKAMVESKLNSVHQQVGVLEVGRVRVLHQREQLLYNNVGIQVLLAHLADHDVKCVDGEVLDLERAGGAEQLADCREHLCADGGVALEVEERGQAHQHLFLELDGVWVIVGDEGLLKQLVEQRLELRRVLGAEIVLVGVELCLYGVQVRQQQQLVAGEILVVENFAEQREYLVGEGELGQLVAEDEQVFAG
ncbi:hypothetical protein OGAPHI_003358 [Ogataea philodendri]|uniref:Delta 8-(E)-sphingolipid desaturase n=1 Tax=Ogataea philodendri TaxID=1378263 RepID=A0A9P8P6W4_9ASCO|nr:uncharacterized protein OGAPHI_003358 [Ogataea philodendri]KAH3666908.1 hypothetical protein OGAPHI_003358 [Ogataea philodendri]